MMDRKDASDQAQGLRNRLAGGVAPSKWPILGSEPLKQANLDGHARVIAVGSGKGGVGKSNVVVNLAIAFDRLGKRVLIMDADLGLANIDVLLGLAPRYNIGHVLDGSKKMEDVLVKGPGSIRIMPAGSGVQQLTRLTDEQKLLFIEMLDGLENEIDILLIDTSAGISDTVIYFNLAAQERVVIVTPEPTSLTDAYALIKVLHTRYGEHHFRILSNSVKDEKMGKAIFSKISAVADHYLDGLSLDYLGYVPNDPCVPRAVIHQKPFLEAFPQAMASQALIRVAERLYRTPPEYSRGNIQFFWKRLLRI